MFPILHNWMDHFLSILDTRGSSFWSSFECEGGSHVKLMHAVSLLIHPNFSSNLMVTCHDLFEISLLIQFEQMKVNQKRNFESYSITLSWSLRNLAFGPPSFVRTGSKARFRTVWKWIKSEFSNKSRHVTIKFEEKLGWIKSETACICFTWLPPSHSKLDQKLDPRVGGSRWKLTSTLYMSY